MKTPVLETKRLLLRPLTYGDAQAVVSNWTRDAEVAKFMRWDVHTNISQTQEWLASEEASIDSDLLYNWGFVLKETGENFFYGNLKALFDNQELQENDRTLGVAYNYLKNFDFSGGKIYENDKCVIRKGIINTTTKKEWKRNNKNTIRK